jgi:GNAT superfamily N-acetyltransferase
MLILNAMRKATIEDYDDVLSMVKSYAYSSPYKTKVNDQALELITKEFLLDKDKVVFYIIQQDTDYDPVNKPIAFIAGAATPFFLGLDTVATEIAWWVHPEHRLNGLGKYLMEAFEEWAKKVGCSMICLSSMDEETGEVYIKRGYSLKEYSYLKVLN